MRSGATSPRRRPWGRSRPTCRACDGGSTGPPRCCSMPAAIAWRSPTTRSTTTGSRRWPIEVVSCSRAANPTRRARSCSGPRRCGGGGRSRSSPTWTSRRGWQPAWRSAGWWRSRTASLPSSTWGGTRPRRGSWASSSRRIRSGSACRSCTRSPCTARGARRTRCAAWPMRVGTSVTSSGWSPVVRCATWRRRSSPRTRRSTARMHRSPHLRGRPRRMPLRRRPGTPSDPPRPAVRRASGPAPRRSSAATRRSACSWTPSTQRPGTRGSWSSRASRASARRAWPSSCGSWRWTGAPSSPGAARTRAARPPPCGRGSARSARSPRTSVSRSPRSPTSSGTRRRSCPARPTGSATSGSSPWPTHSNEPQRPRRSSSCSTTCSGPTRHRSSSSATWPAGSSVACSSSAPCASSRWGATTP